MALLPPPPDLLLSRTNSKLGSKLYGYIVLYRNCSHCTDCNSDPYPDSCLIHTARDRDRDRDGKMMGFCITLCTVHTTQGQGQASSSLSLSRSQSRAVCIRHKIPKFLLCPFSGRISVPGSGSQSVSGICK